MNKRLSSIAIAMPGTLILMFAIKLQYQKKKKNKTNKNESKENGGFLYSVLKIDCIVKCKLRSFRDIF